jgi:LuxR family maltose regulon positive regulatory protein
VSPVIEPLTNRELELLHLLPTHLSNAAMGERLYVSVNTVKTNLRAVYRKLGTTSRAETVVRARRLGLLPPEIGAG